jgi:hypothetical protein
MKAGQPSSAAGLDQCAPTFNTEFQLSLPWYYFATSGFKLLQ